MSADFESALGAVAGIEGWLTDAQARRLWDRAAALDPAGQIVEIGSYRGRSAVILARAARAGVAVTAIDPHAGNDRGPHQIRGTVGEGRTDNDAFVRNLRRAGVAERVRHVRLHSQDALASVEGTIDLLYVDGAHRYRPARDDLARWGGRVAPGGTLLVHDAFSSIGVTVAIMRLLAFGSRFAYAGRTGSLAEYTRVDLAGAARVRNAGRQVAQLPWFLRNVLVKVALLGRLGLLARLLGHRGRDWPY